MSNHNPKTITYHQAFQEILEFFNGDKDKAIAWYTVKNPALGGVSPYEMIKEGRGAKLMKFIRSALAGNHP
jgi:hypothetical protein